MTLTLKFETFDNFPLPFNEFYVSQDSFKQMVDKYIANISLTNEKIKYAEYSTRSQQIRNLWQEHRKEKLKASNSYIAAINIVEPSKRGGLCFILLLKHLQ